MRHLYIFDDFSSSIVQISRATFHRFPNVFSKNDLENERVVLTLWTVNSKNWVTIFHGLFHFSFSFSLFLRKYTILLSHKCQMPRRYIELCSKLEMKKTYLLGDLASFRASLNMWPFFRALFVLVTIVLHSCIQRFYKLQWPQKLN